MTNPVGVVNAVPRRDVVNGSGSLTPEFAALYQELFDMQNYLLRVCSARNPDHLLAGFDGLKAGLIAAALLCDDDAKRRRELWTPTPEYKHRWYKAKSFDDEHPYWDQEQRFIRDFFDQRLMRRMARNAKDHLQSMYARSSDYDGPLIGDNPISGYLVGVESIEEYRRNRRGREKSRRKAKEWAKAQLKIVKISAILVADCIDFTPRDKHAEMLASNAFEISYALTMGASRSAWKAA